MSQPVRPVFVCVVCYEFCVMLRDVTNVIASNKTLGGIAVLIRVSSRKMDDVHTAIEN